MKPELRELLANEAGEDVLMMADILSEEPDTEDVAVPLLYKGKEYTVYVRRTDVDDGD